jgi:hypothetical protein
MSTPTLTAADVLTLGDHEVGQMMHDLEDPTVMSANIWVNGVVVGKIMGGPAKKGRIVRKAAFSALYDGAS